MSKFLEVLHVKTFQGLLLCGVEKYPNESSLAKLSCKTSIQERDLENFRKAPTLEQQDHRFPLLLASLPSTCSYKGTIYSRPLNQWCGGRCHGMR